MGDRKYWELLTFISIGYVSAACLLAGWLQADARAVKFSAVIAGVQWLSLEYAMSWDNEGNEGADYPNPTYGSIFEDFGCKDVEDNGECGQYKAGFVILFLAAVFNIIAVHPRRRPGHYPGRTPARRVHPRKGHGTRPTNPGARLPLGCRRRTIRRASPINNGLSLVLTIMGRYCLRQ